MTEGGLCEGMSSITFCDSVLMPKIKLKYEITLSTNETKYIPVIEMIQISYLPIQS